MIDLFTINYGEGFVRWGQPFRLTHMSSDKFLAIGERGDVTLVDSHEADNKQTAFAFVKKSVSYNIMVILRTVITSVAPLHAFVDNVLNHSNVLPEI